MTESQDTSTQFDRAAWDAGQHLLGAVFLQSSGWGDFQTATGHQPYYLSGDGWSCLLVSRRAAFGKYLFAPYGPTLSANAKLQPAVKSLIRLARNEGADWLRIEPLSADGNLESALIKAGARRAPKNVEPPLTRIVDITLDENSLLASLSQTTRNIIRRSQRQKPLSFRTSTDPADMKIFSDMLDTVASRKHVGFYNHGYYQAQAQVLMPLGMMRLELAYDGQEPVGAAVIHDYGDTCTYTYAASLPQARDKSVSALLLWQAMLNAKSRGIKKIDLFGIAPDDAPASHPWAGFSSFKKKFGGQVLERSGTWDIPLTGRYRLYRVGLRVKRLARR